MLLALTLFVFFCFVIFPCLNTFFCSNDFAFYIIDLATQFDSFYGKIKFMLPPSSNKISNKICIFCRQNDSVPFFKIGLLAGYFILNCFGKFEVFPRRFTVCISKYLRYFQVGKYSWLVFIRTKFFRCKVLIYFFI